MDSSVLAIARMLRIEDAGLVLAEVTATLGNAQKTPREAAALALGGHHIVELGGRGRETDIIKSGHRNLSNLGLPPNQDVALVGTH